LRSVYRQVEDVEMRLEKLGLDTEILKQAVNLGLLARLECTENDPSSFPGICSWAASVRSLREQLIPRGWERLNDRNLPLTVNRSLGIAITASSGDDCTGIEGLFPRTRNPKGVTTQQKVKSNAEQLGLFTDTTDTPEELIAEVKKWNTWLLLSYRDVANRKIRCELSCPIGLGPDGRVDEWSERIILEDILFDGDSVLLIRGNGDTGDGRDGAVDFETGSAEIDFEVKRRAS
jgi:hypothetical protein